VSQLVLFELITKLASGLALLAAPLTLITLFGLAPAASAFWPRLLGAFLLGLTAATYMDVSVRLGHGLGLAGAMVINFAVSMALAAGLILGQSAPTRRGRVFLGGIAAALFMLALAEIAYI
jgi:hypothetical protein